MDLSRVVVGEVSTFLPGEKPWVKGHTEPWQPWGSGSSSVKWAPLPTLSLPGVAQGAMREGDGGERALGSAVGLELGPHVSPSMGTGQGW